MSATGNPRNISKSVRFEVFKRDSFTCQYCGNKAPDVILHIDHIHPVSKGGDRELTNLITACGDCNGGKGARELDDDTVVRKQQRQLEELNERRVQLEMQKQWRDELSTLEDDTVEQVLAKIAALDTGYRPNMSGLAKIRKWLKTYNWTDLCDAIGPAFDAHLQLDEDGNADKESWDRAFNAIPKFARMVRLTQDEKSLYYTRGILRNRVTLYSEADCLQLLRSA